MAAPASLTEQFDTLYSTTWQNMREQAIDQIFKATPLTYRLYQKGIKRESGGRWIGYQLLYGKNTTVKTIGIGGAADVVNDELITTAKDDWKWLIANIIRYFGEDTMNQNKAQIMSMVQAKLKVAELSIVDALESMLIRGPGSLTGTGTDFNGICTFITPDGSGSPGGINSATYTWWANQFKDCANTDAATIMSDVLSMYNTCSIGNDHPTLLLGTQKFYEFYERRLVNILRTYDTSLGDMGFEALRYKGSAWTFSPSITTSLTNGAGGAVFVGGDSDIHGLFFLNERYWDFVVHPDADFMMTEWKPIPNQLDRVSQIVVQGNLICTNRRMQGLLFDVDDTLLGG